MKHPAPLRVCHLGKYYPPAPGGIESHVQTLAGAQARLGADVRVVCVNHADRRGRDVTWTRYGATRTEEQMDGLVHVTRLGRSATFARLDFCASLPWIIKELNHNPVDVLHLHTPNPTMVITVANLLRHDVPLVITHHSDIVRQRMLRWLHGPFEKVVYDRAAAIFTSSPMYMEGSELLQEHEHKVHSVPMGIDLAPFANPSPAALMHAARLRKQYGETIWLAVGRLVYYKGLEVALEALRQVSGVLLMVGHGPMVYALRQRARELGVADRVIWYGHADPDQLVGAYLAAKALWFPSTHRSEAYGLVQVEAMASGCPVINTRIFGSGVWWVSPHGQTGLTVRVNDVDAFAAAARRILHEPALRQWLSQGAVRRAREEFDHTTMARRTLSIYERLVANRSAPEAPARERLREWVRVTSGNGALSGRQRSFSREPAPRG